MHLAVHAETDLHINSDFDPSQRYKTTVDLLRMKERNLYNCLQVYYCILYIRYIQSKNNYVITHQYSNTDQEYI